MMRSGWRRREPEVTDLPPPAVWPVMGSLMTLLLAGAALALQAGVAWLVPVLAEPGGVLASATAGLHPEAAGWGRAVAAMGGTLAVLGLALAGWAAQKLHAAGAGWLSGPAMLVDEGPYRLCRHPMYLGLTLALAGTGVALAWPGLLLGTLGYALLLWQWQVPREEQQLARSFGGWWQDYAAQVRI